MGNALGGAGFDACRAADPNPSQGKGPEGFVQVTPSPTLFSPFARPLSPMLSRLLPAPDLFSSSPPPPLLVYPAAAAAAAPPAISAPPALSAPAPAAAAPAPAAPTPAAPAAPSRTGSAGVAARDRQSAATSIFPLSNV